MSGFSYTTKRGEQMGATSQNPEAFHDYEGFVEKFKPKKTTDDCYPPPLVYDAVADWTAKEYGLDRADFVRPFYPGGDYEHFDYVGKIVVDNRPFLFSGKSLISTSKIISGFCCLHRHLWACAIC